MKCYTCELAKKNAKLLEEQELEQRASGQCFFTEHEGKTTITVYGAIDEEEKQQLIALLLKIELKREKANERTGK